MKMKKIITAALTAGILAATLTGCGSGSGSTASTDGNSTAESSAASAASGETVDTGIFKTFVPEGWLAYPQSDYTQEADSSGAYPVAEDSYGMIKDGKSEWDALSNPTVYIYYWEKVSAADEAEASKFFYDEATDLTVSANGVDCVAFEAKTESLSAEGKYDVYDFIFIPVTDTDCIQITIPVTIYSDANNSVGVSMDDADVQAIINGTVMD